MVTGEMLMSGETAMFISRKVAESDVHDWSGFWPKKKGGSLTTFFLLMNMMRPTTRLFSCVLFCVRPIVTSSSDVMFSPVPIRRAAGWFVSQRRGRFTQWPAVSYTSNYCEDKDATWTEEGSLPGGDPINLWWETQMHGIAGNPAWILMKNNMHI